MLSERMCVVDALSRVCGLGRGLGLAPPEVEVTQAGDQWHQRISS